MVANCSGRFLSPWLHHQCGSGTRKSDRSMFPPCSHGQIWTRLTETDSWLASSGSSPTRERGRPTSPVKSSPEVKTKARVRTGPVALKKPEARTGPRRRRSSTAARNRTRWPKRRPRKRRKQRQNPGNRRRLQQRLRQKLRRSGSGARKRAVPRVVMRRGRDRQKRLLSRPRTARRELIQLTGGGWWNLWFIMIYQRHETPA
jgi:hypothetical protein